MSPRILGRPALAVASGVLGLVLTAALAGPASAAPPPTTPPPALTAFATQTSIGAASPAGPAAGVSSQLVKPAALVGKRQTFTRGSTLAWSSDTFEWYWNGGTMSSSSAWQNAGYVFPNTVTLRGVKRSLATSTTHLWHGTASIGAGVVTPWGAVDVYTTTITDYFTLTPGSLTHTN